jgi:hypothetical protein
VSLIESGAPQCGQSDRFVDRHRRVPVQFMRVLRAEQLPPCLCASGISA